MTALQSVPRSKSKTPPAPVEDDGPLLMLLPDVCVAVRLSRETIWLYVRTNRFPKPLRPGGKKSRRVAWLASEVRAWVKQRAEERNQG